MPLVIALVPMKCHSRNLQFSSRVPFAGLSVYVYMDYIKCLAASSCFVSKKKFCNVPLKTLDTIGNCQRPVFSLSVSQQLHKTKKSVQI